jgi:hypothetical protein
MNWCFARIVDRHSTGIDQKTKPVIVTLDDYRLIDSDSDHTVPDVTKDPSIFI